MNILKLIAGLLLSIIICKLLSFVMVLLFITIKNRKLKKDTTKWDQWFDQISKNRITFLMSSWYLLSVLLASIVTYYIFIVMHVPNAVMITVVFLIVRILITLYRYIKNKETLFEKFKKNVVKS